MVTNYISRYIFKLSLFIISTVMLLMSINSGINCDEPIDYKYGESAYKYFSSFGEDKSYKEFEYNDTKITHHKYYGGGFELSSYIIAKVFDNKYSFTVRHILCSIFGIILILFSGLTAKIISNKSAGVITMWLMFITPQILGYSCWNSKDIPTAAGFAMGLYFFIRFIKELPSPSFISLIGATLSIAISVSVRIVGVLLPMYFVVFVCISLIFRKDLRLLIIERKFNIILSIILKISMICVLGILIGLLFYPNFYESPLTHLFDSISFASKANLGWRQLYDGVPVKVTDTPKYYILESIYERVPSLILILFHFGLIFLFFMRKQIRTQYIFMVLFASIFPVLYVYINNSSVYNGWRHIMFFYSGITVISALTLFHLYNISHKCIRLIIIIIMVIGVGDLLTYNYQSRHSLYTNFNRFCGSTRINIDKYDLDALQLTASVAYKWLTEQESFRNSMKKGKNPIVMSNSTSLNYVQVDEYIKNNVSIVRGGFRAYSHKKWDYAIITRLFMSPEYIDMFYPPKGTIKEYKIEGKTVCAIIKRDNYYDIEGIKAAKMKNFNKAIYLLSKSFKYDKSNHHIWFWFGYSLYMKKEYNKAISFLKSNLKIYKNDYNSLNILGVIYLSKKEYNTALIYLKQCGRLKKSQKVIKQIIHCYKKMNNKPEAEKFTKILNSMR